jgi:hypothetical protein
VLHISIAPRFVGTSYGDNATAVLCISQRVRDLRRHPSIVAMQYHSTPPSGASKLLMHMPRGTLKWYIYSSSGKKHIRGYKPLTLVLRPRFLKSSPWLIVFFKHLFFITLRI